MPPRLGNPPADAPCLLQTRWQRCRGPRAPGCLFTTCITGRLWAKRQHRHRLRKKISASTLELLCCLFRLLTCSRACLHTPAPLPQLAGLLQPGHGHEHQPGAESRGLHRLVSAWGCRFLDVGCLPRNTFTTGLVWIYAGFWSGRGRQVQALFVQPSMRLAHCVPCYPCPAAPCRCHAEPPCFLRCAPPQPHGRARGRLGARVGAGVRRKPGNPAGADKAAVELICLNL